jgi:cobyrinic acid a,c-diamide synthase
MKQGSAMPCLVIAAGSSGAGKTTVTIALIEALRRRGLTVQPFKCGPDYIDPSYHSLVAGRPCRSLDAWMLEEGQLVETFQRACHGADIAIIEGVMGVFDGAGWDSDGGSTAHIARLLGAPVILVIDISGAARSAAIAAAGVQKLDPGLRLSAAILNYAGSKTHAEGCAKGIEDLTGLPSLGWLPRDLNLGIPERHLGLMQSVDAGRTRTLIEALGRAATEQFKLEDLLTIAKASDAQGALPEPVRSGRRPVAAGQPVLAVARDEAFSFYYPENLELLEEHGVRVVYFSPVRGETPRADVAGVYFGGGYPELYAQALSQNTALWAVLRAAHARDAPIYAECGGFMVLTEGVSDLSGQFWPMAGLLPGRTGMSEKLVALGYRWARALRANLLTSADEVLRAHEFHYSRWSVTDAEPASAAAWRIRGTQVQSPEADAGFTQGNLLASYLHVHFGQRPGIAQRFAERLHAQVRN